MLNPTSRQWHSKGCIMSMLLVCVDSFSVSKGRRHICWRQGPPLAPSTGYGARLSGWLVGWLGGGMGVRGRVTGVIRLFVCTARVCLLIYASSLTYSSFSHCLIHVSLMHVFRTPSLTLFSPFLRTIFSHLIHSF